MLSIYDPYEEVFFNIPAFRVPLRHLASELLDEFGISNEAEFEKIMEKAFDVCFTLDIPINVHFRKIFLYANDQLITDWLLSDLATYLLLMNGDVRNYKVAQAQVYSLKGNAKSGNQ